MALGQQPLVNDVVEQGGFSGAADATETNQALQGDGEIEIAEIVFGDAVKAQPLEILFCHHRPALRGKLDAFAAGEIGAGDALRRSRHFRDGALEHDVPAAAAGFRADFNHVIGGADHGLVVFDHDDGIARVGERTDDADEAVDVARVQADARLVEDKEGVPERGAQAAGEVDALNFTAAQRARTAVEREITEANLSPGKRQAGQNRNRARASAECASTADFGSETADFETSASSSPTGSWIKSGQGVAAPFPARAPRAGGAPRRSRGRRCINGHENSGRGRRAHASCRSFDSSQRK